MSWTQFVGVMRDGREFSFGTTYHTEFFNMPSGYTAADIVAIQLHECGSGKRASGAALLHMFHQGY